MRFIPLSAAVIVIAFAPAFAATSGPAITMKTSKGTVLATPQGMTLYSFAHDAQNNSESVCGGGYAPDVLLGRADLSVVGRATK